MAIPFNPRGDGNFRKVAVDQFGMPVEIAFLPDGGIAERRVIPESVIEGLKKETAADRDSQPRGSMLGNTQKHRLKVMELPLPLAASLKRRFGPFSRNRKDWMKWLNNEGSVFLSSQYRIG
jgi:hypothetical protein